jgi:hypothetical protein
MSEEEIKQVECVKRGVGRPKGSKNGQITPLEENVIKFNHNEFMKDYYKKNREVILERAKLYSKEKYKNNEEYRKMINVRSNIFRLKTKEKVKQLEEILSKHPELK